VDEIEILPSSLVPESFFYGHLLIICYAGLLYCRIPYHQILNSNEKDSKLQLARIIEGIK